MTRITTAEILRNDRDASAAYTILNNQGEGFDPSDDIADWTLVSEADTTDGVSVYTDTDGLGNVYLVSTDGSGSDDSRWAVRVGDVGVEYGDDD